jgi:hypothetical protein
LILLPVFGAPGAIRTPDPLVRSQVLYPAELRAHAQYCTAFCLLLKALIHNLQINAVTSRTIDLEFLESEESYRYKLAHFDIKLVVVTTYLMTAVLANSSTSTLRFASIKPLVTFSLTSS